MRFLTVVQLLLISVTLPKCRFFCLNLEFQEKIRKKYLIKFSHCDKIYPLRWADRKIRVYGPKITKGGFFHDLQQEND